MVAASMGGLLHVTGDPAGPPTKVEGNWIVTKVAEVGSLSAKAKMPTKFTSGAYFLFLRQMRCFYA